MREKAGQEAGLVTLVPECALATFTQRAVGFSCNARCDKMGYGREIGHDVSRVCGVCVAGVNSTVIFHFLRPPTAISRVPPGTLETT